MQAEDVSRGVGIKPERNFQMARTVILDFEQGAAQVKLNEKKIGRGGHDV